MTKIRKSPYGERIVIEKLPEVEGLIYKEPCGRGHFSTVYEGIYDEDVPVAIKVLERGDEEQCEKEIDLLNKIRSCKYVPKLLFSHRDICYILVFEFISHMDVGTVLSQLTVERIRTVLHAVLSALKYAHSLDIIHRDLTLSNVLISGDWRTVKLIDWGCGILVQDEMKSNEGCRTSRAPEMLLGYTKYTSKADMWSVGMIIIELLTMQKIPWAGNSSKTVLEKLSEFFGASDIRLIAGRYGIDISQLGLSEVPKKSFVQEIDPRNAGLLTEDLKDLCTKLLTVDPDARLSASEALEHNFFKPPKKSRCTI